jgi:hypothetical protein
MFPEGGGPEMSTEEERALVLRRIAASGYSIWDDQDGSTANTLLEIAESIAPISPPPAHRKRGFLYTSLRRVYLRLKLRAKLRWLGLVPILAVLWAVVEVRALGAQQGDSLYQLPMTREALGAWAPTRIWCVDRAADFGTLLVIVSVVPADSARCVRSDGTHAPLFIDATACPPPDFDPGSYPFVIFRCGTEDYRRYKRTFGVKRT